MSFLSREKSVDSSKPIELYHIKAGLREWFYTSARKDIVYLTRNYEARTLRRTNIESAREYNKANLSFTAPGTLPMSLLFLQDPPEGLVTLEIYRTHKDDSEFATYWKGRIVGVSFSGAESTIRAESVYTSLRGQGRRKAYSTQCGWTLYKIGCYVNDQQYKSVGILAGVSGVTLSSAAFGNQPTGYYNGGKIVVWVDGEPYNRRIESHTGTTVTIIGQVTGLAAGTEVEAYPGCDHTHGTCKAKFDNTINYGGFPWKPKKDPFSGSAAF